MYTFGIFDVNSAVLTIMIRSMIEIAGFNVK